MPKKNNKQKIIKHNKMANEKIKNTKKKYEQNLHSYLLDHSPELSKYWLGEKKILDRILHHRPFEMIVLAADIRKSTFLMKESIDFTLFASILGEFIEFSRMETHKRQGWFDKFTGDGFLAYWIYNNSDESVNGTISKVMTTAKSIMNNFQSTILDSFRKNSRNFPEGIGLSIGIDAGPSNMVDIANDITIVGPAVVGAVRMVSIAEKVGETIANVYLGEYLYGPEGLPLLDRHSAEIKREYRQTKEYDSQEVYVINFKTHEPVAR